MMDGDREESKTTIDSAVIMDATNNDINLDLLIDNNYEGALKPTVDAALQAKWSTVLGPEYEIIVSSDDGSMRKSRRLGNAIILVLFR